MKEPPATLPKQSNCVYIPSLIYQNLSESVYEWERENKLNQKKLFCPYLTLFFVMFVFSLFYNVWKIILIIYRLSHKKIFHLNIHSYPEQKALSSHVYFLGKKLKFVVKFCFSKLFFLKIFFPDTEWCNEGGESCFPKLKVSFLVSTTKVVFPN